MGKKINFVAKLPSGKRCAELDEDELAPIEEYPESSLKGIIEENSLVEMDMPQPPLNLDGSLIDLLDDMSF